MFDGRCARIITRLIQEHSTEIIVRLEEKSDYLRVEQITREAFNYEDRIIRGGIGCPYEHWMVHSLRERDGILNLSYVAEIDKKIVGHIIYSKAYIENEEHRIIPVLNLGPLSVLPEYQRRGIGKILMTRTITATKELGYGAIVFFGRPEYYPQFGFKEAKNYNITDVNGSNYPSFMAMELVIGYLKNVKGRFIESNIYNDDINKESVICFDKSFICM